MALAPIHPEGPDIDSTLAPVQPEGLDVTGGGGGGSPGGASGTFQYNDAGSFGGTAGLTWNSAGTGSLLMQTGDIYLSLASGGDIQLVGGVSTQAGLTVGSDDQVQLGNPNFRFSILPNGELDLNNSPGNAGDLFTSSGAGIAPTWAPPSGTLPTPTDTSGYEDVQFTTPKVGGDSTGLANDATVYSAQIEVDGGGAQSIDVTGSAAQTFTDLLAEINADLTGATAALVAGQLRVTSDSTGATSTIVIIDTGSLFSTLTDFRSIHGPVNGETTVGFTARYTGLAWESTNLVRVIDQNSVIQIGPVVSYPSTGNGFSIQIYAQGGGVDGDFNGGSVQLVGGSANGNGTGGSASVQGGAGSGWPAAGSPTDVSEGGSVEILSGAGWNEASGSILIRVPTPSASTVSANGNTVTIEGGTAASAGGAVSGGNVNLFGGVEAGGGDDGSVVIGINNVDSASRNGNFLYIPTSAGTPTGTPIVQGVLTPLVYDSMNQRIYVYDVNTADWRFAATT